MFSIQPAVLQRARLVSRDTRPIRSHGRTSVLVRSMLGPYQYKTRVARLRLKGAHVHEFGDRVLQQGSFGDDVMQLQAYLAEQGYFAADDGLSGYFGDATGQALQAWQRDQGLHATAVFDANSKWAYLRQQEAALQQATQAQASQAAVVVSPPSVPESWRFQQPGLATGALGLAALVAGAVMASSRMRQGRSGPGLAELGRLLRWAVHTLAGATAEAGRGAAVAGRAVQQALEPPGPQVTRARRARGLAPPPTPASAGATAAERGEFIGNEFGAAASAHTARQPMPEEAPAFLGTPVGGSARVQQGSKPSRLSDDELQQRIAVMKGEVSPRTPVPQRPAPRKLPLGVPKPVDDPIMGSKYGTYYGGRQVRDQVKQYLDGDSGMPHAARASNPAQRRVEMPSFHMGSRPRPASKPAKPQVAAARPMEQVVTASAAVPSPEVEIMLGGGAFRDVEAAAQQRAADDAVEAANSVPAKVLLTGTELEKSPERRGPFVPVVKPGMAIPMTAQPGNGAASSGPVAGPAPRPVPVVKPQKRATIGDMLRASLVGDADEEPPSSSIRPGNGSYGFAATPAQPPYQQQAPRPVPDDRSYPVQTGSPYRTNGGAGAGTEGRTVAAAVQYDAEGCVVLDGKPIKLVKPAHLLSKTYGYQNGPEEPTVAPQQQPYLSGTEPERLGGGDVFGSLRRRGI